MSSSYASFLQPNQSINQMTEHLQPRHIATHTTVKRLKRQQKINVRKLQKVKNSIDQQVGKGKN